MKMILIINLNNEIFGFMEEKNGKKLFRFLKKKSPPILNDTRTI